MSSLHMKKTNLHKAAIVITLVTAILLLSNEMLQGINKPKVKYTMRDRD